MGTARFCSLLAVMFCFAGELSYGSPEATTIKLAAVPGGDTPSKFENGLQIFWRSTSFPGDPNPGEADPEARVRVFAGAKHELAVCHVAGAIESFDPSFTGVSIYDVSARQPGLIVVAAVYSRASSNPEAVLLYFDWNGLLLRRVVLSNRPAIQSVEVVGADQIWTLNDFDPMDRSRFVFAEFDRNGILIKEVVRSHSGWSTEEGMFKGGRTSFGVIGNRVWAWLPKPQTLLSFDSFSGKTEAKHTGFPVLGQSSELYARQAVLLPDGQLLMDIGWIRQGKRIAGWFMWSAQAGWQQVRSPSNNSYLYAVEGNEVIFTAAEEMPGASPVFRSEYLNDLTAYVSPR